MLGRCLDSSSSLSFSGICFLAQQHTLGLRHVASFGIGALLQVWVIERSIGRIPDTRIDIDATLRIVKFDPLFQGTISPSISLSDQHILNLNYEAPLKLFRNASFFNFLISFCLSLVSRVNRSLHMCIYRRNVLAPCYMVDNYTTECKDKIRKCVHFSSCKTATPWRPTKKTCACIPRFKENIFFIRQFIKHSLWSSEWVHD